MVAEGRTGIGARRCRRQRINRETGTEKPKKKKKVLGSPRLRL